MKSLFKNALIISMLVCLPFIAPGAQASADVEKATAYVDKIAAEALDILNNGGSKSSQTEKLEKLIKEHVDIDWIGKFVMGKHWRTASKQQQADYLKHYEDFILQSYASRFTEYSGDGYKMLNSRSDGNDKFTVKMSIDVDGQSTGVDYKIRQKGNAYKIYDLKVEGVSLITTQRSEFNSIIQNKGIDYLISQLASKSGNEIAKN